MVTFPALLALGLPPINANATSTVALWPAAVGSMWGYRDELRGSRPWAIGFAMPSLLGGALGAWLLLKTPPQAFATTELDPPRVRWVRTCSRECLLQTPGQSSSLV